MTKLDEIAVNVELVLISLIEGVALIALGFQTVAALQDPEWYRYVPFILTGFTLLLFFWTQSIMHAISFIRWPIRVEHLFLYFALGLVQIVAYSYLLNLASWFFFWSVFSLVAMGMYFLDLWIIRESEKDFTKISGGKEFIEKVEKRHIFEMKYLVPSALALHVFLWLLAIVFPKFFQPVWIYMIPGTLQLLFSGYALYDCTKNFRERSVMITELFREKGAMVSQQESKKSKKSSSMPAL